MRRGRAGTGRRRFGGRDRRGASALRSSSSVRWRWPLRPEGAAASDGPGVLPRNRTGDQEIRTPSDRYRSAIGQGKVADFRRSRFLDGQPVRAVFDQGGRRREGAEPPSRISKADAWRALYGWRARARPTAEDMGPAAAGAAAREGFDRGRTRCHQDRRCNNGKEVIPCLTLRWRVAQVRRTRLWSRPPGSADAAGNINLNKSA